MEWYSAITLLTLYSSWSHIHTNEKRPTGTWQKHSSMKQFWSEERDEVMNFRKEKKHNGGIQDGEY